MTLRDLFEIVSGAPSSRAGRWYARFAIAMVALGLLSASLYTVIELQLRGALAEVIRVVGGFLVVEFIVRFVLVPYGAAEELNLLRRRLSYLMTGGGIVDLAAALIGGLALVNGAAAGGIIIIYFIPFAAPKLARYSAVPGLVCAAFHRERRRLRSIAAQALVFAMIATTLVYLAERAAQPAAFSSIPAAFWYLMGTMTFVGYGDVIPVTVLGRALAIVTMMAGILFLALVVAVLSLALSDEVRRRNFIVLWTLVAKWPPLAHLPALQIAQIAALLEPVSVRRGETIVTRGDQADAIYFILSGTVRVLSAPSPITLSEGNFFGELALVSGVTRSASVIAQTAAELMRLRTLDLQRLIAREPNIAGRTLAEAMRGIREPARPSDQVTA